MKSPFRDIEKMPANDVGQYGERFLDQVCKECGIRASCDGYTTKKKGGGEGDGHIMGRTIEIKTARLNSNLKSFQHELCEKPWMAEYMLFVDIAPKFIYLTIFKNFNESTYKSGQKAKPYFPNKTVTWRKNQGNFKLDTTVKINETSAYTTKIDSETSMESVAEFIKRHIAPKE